MKALFAFMVLLVSTVITPAALAQELDGQISGVVLGSGGRPLAGQQVELRRPSREGPGQLVAITNAAGEFAYPRLGLGRYQVEWHIRGRVVANSAQIELSELMMQVSNVTLALPDAKVVIDRFGVGEKTRVNVDLLDGTKVGGYIRGTDEESFTVTEPNGFRTTTVAYNDVLKVSKGRSELAKLLIFVGVSMGVGVVLTVIAVVAAGGGSR